MALGDVNTSLLTDLFVEDIEPSVNDQLKFESMLHSFIESNVSTHQLENYSYSVPLKVGRGSSTFGTTEAGGNNVVTGSPQYKKVIMTAKVLTVAFNISYQSLSIKPGGAVDPILDRLTTDIAADYVQDWNRMAWGLGDGAIGVTNALVGSASTALVLAPSANGDIDYAEMIPVGSFVKIASGTVQQVASVDVNTITLSGSGTTWAQGATVYRTDSQGNVSVELTGLPKLIGTGSLYSYSSNIWKAAVTSVSNSTTLTSEDQVNRPFVKSRKDGNVSAIFANMSMYADYMKLMTAMKRTANSTEQMVGGYKVVAQDFMGGMAKLYLDFQCPDNGFFGLDPASVEVIELEPFHFLKDNGQISLRKTGTINYEVVGVHPTDLIVTRRNSNFIVNNFTKTA